MTTTPATAQESGQSADEVASTALADLQFCCGQRAAALHSPDFGEDILAEFDERIAANLDALLSRGPLTIAWLQGQLADAAEPGDVCGIAFALLQSGDAEANAAVLAALASAEDEPRRRGLSLALRHGAREPIFAALGSWLITGSPWQCALAAAVLAFHGKIGKTPDRVSRLLSDADPLVRRAAWQAAALLPDHREATGARHS